MSEVNCEKCRKKKHCFVKEFKVLSCEDYQEEAEEGEKKDEVLSRNHY